MEPLGQLSAANWTLVQTVLMWLWSRKDDLGSLTAASAMFASPGLMVSVAINAGFLLRLVPPLSRRTSLGAKSKPRQPPTWKRLDRGATWPRRLIASPPTAVGSQLVGLRVKLGRSTSTEMLRTSNGIPWRMV